MSEREFARDKEEAEQRAKFWKSKDPFPNIPPTLLNFTDIYWYVQKTAMVFPFDPSPDSIKEKLKSASYEIDFLGEVRSWPDTEKPESSPKITRIEKDTEFWIPKNSIVFVSPNTKFRLPDYMALRFNLRIKHVHRGLLLGTGPLIDPGFQGQLFIPLHNLTSEDYRLVGGEGLIWVEFTKLSPNKKWDEKASLELVEYKDIPSSKSWPTPLDYIKKASDGRAIRSSIPGEIQKAKNDAEGARRDAEEAKRYVNMVKNFGVVAIIMLIIGLFTLGYQVSSLVQDANAFVRDAQADLESTKKEVADLKEKVAGMDDAHPKTNSEGDNGQGVSKDESSNSGSAAKDKTDEPGQEGPESAEEQDAQSVRTGGPE